MRPPVQSRSQATLSRFLDAAEELLGEGGFGELTLSALSDRAGLTTGAFYARFASKEDLALPLVERIAEETSGMLSEWERSLPGKSLEAVVRDLLERVVELYERRASLLRALIGLARSNAQVRTMLQEANGREFGRMLSRFSELLKADGRAANGTTVLLGLLCVLNTLREVVLERVLFDGPYAIAQTTLIDELSAFFLCRLRSPGGEPDEIQTP